MLKIVDKQNYPWHSLESKMNDQHETTFYLAGLGSLINCKSAARTLRHATQPAKPIKVLGFMRVYDYVIAEERLPNREETLSYPHAALNAYPDADHWFNGVLLKVSLEDVPAFRQREVGYDLVPALYVPYDDRHATPRSCYVLSRPRIPSIYRLISKGLAPAPAYHQVCRDGAAKISRGFLRDFYRTTYLADRETRLEEVLGDLELKPKAAKN